MSDPVLGVLLRVHKRSQTLRIVLDEYKRLGRLRGVQIRIHVMADRPTREVQEILKERSTNFWACVSAKQPLLSKEYGELFMQGLNAQLDHFEPCHCDWYTIQDDDGWFEPTSITEELPDLLRSRAVDMWYAHTIYMWEEPAFYHAERPHHSVKLFRSLPGDRFPTNRIIHATELLHDQAIMQGRFATMKTPILDYGCITPEERRRVYDAFIEAGKVDPFTASLTAPARLAKFPEDAIRAGLAHRADWTDLWTRRNP